MQRSIQRAPGPALKPFIAFLWASMHPSTPERLMLAERERMIPSGGMHLVFRVSDQPIRVFKSITDPESEAFYFGALGGIRSTYYVKDIARNACTVGASLRPGACQALFGIPANEVSGRHVALENLWGMEARLLSERLQETGELAQRLDILECFLVSRLSDPSELHPAMAHALNRFSASSHIARLVQETGYSHRHFIQLFRETVGTSPRTYSRLLRFQKTLRRGIDTTKLRWIDVALEAGYADQAHFNREFRQLTGITPTEYLLTRAEDLGHVPIRGQFRSIQGRTGEA
ncbi:MAG TPA: AraC family transcriptional regulator [Terriglobia bacterium]|nr:AraC family transcriptional regulator [Terriglobia bacterium]